MNDAWIDKLIDMGQSADAACWAARFPLPRKSISPTVGCGYGSVYGAGRGCGDGGDFYFGCGYGFGYGCGSMSCDEDYDEYADGVGGGYESGFGDRLGVRALHTIFGRNKRRGR